MTAEAPTVECWRCGNERRIDAFCSCMSDKDVQAAYRLERSIREGVPLDSETAGRLIVDVEREGWYDA